MGSGAACAWGFIGPRGDLVVRDYAALISSNYGKIMCLVGRGGRERETYKKVRERVETRENGNVKIENT